MQPIQLLIDALDHYDQSSPVRDEMFNNIQTQESYTAWEAAEQAALDKVREAFYAATKPQFTRKMCSLMTIVDARNLVKFSEGHLAQPAPASRVKIIKIYRPEEVRTRRTSAANKPAGKKLVKWGGEKVGSRLPRAHVAR